MRSTWLFLTSLCLICGFSVRAEDKALAAGFAQAAAKLAAEGKTEKARDLCFKALANDENCPEALFELGKIFEKEGNKVAAADFLVRASRELGSAEAENPAFASKRKEADTKVLGLNPYATRFTLVLADYTVELNTITKKMTDTITLEEACDRADQLKLRTMLPPDKAPKFERPAVASGNKSKMNDDGPNSGLSRIHRPNTNAPTVVPPDVERALKAAGWTTITGTWKKKSENVYEVTDGKLEAPFVNGALQVIVHKGSGPVRALVRNSTENDYYSSSSYASGYGFIVEDAGAKLFTPSGGYSNNKYYPYLEREDPLGSGLPKNLVAVMIEEGRLEYFLNGQSRKKANYPISRSGNFVISMEGNCTIESPMAKGTK